MGEEHGTWNVNWGLQKIGFGVTCLELQDLGVEGSH